VGGGHRPERARAGQADYVVALVEVVEPDDEAGAVVALLEPAKRVARSGPTITTTVEPAALATGAELDATTTVLGRPRSPATSSAAGSDPPVAKISDDCTGAVEFTGERVLNPFVSRNDVTSSAAPRTWVPLATRTWTVATGGGGVVVVDDEFFAWLLEREPLCEEAVTGLTGRVEPPVPSDPSALDDEDDEAVANGGRVADGRNRMPMTTAPITISNPFVAGPSLSWGCP